MSPKATEGVGSTGRNLLLLTEEANALRAATPSSLPAISPSRGEIAHSPNSFGVSSRLLHYIRA